MTCLCTAAVGEEFTGADWMAVGVPPVFVGFQNEGGTMLGIKDTGGALLFVS